LRVKGLASPEVLSALSGVAQADLDSECTALIDDGYVVFRDGTMGCYMLTAHGKAEADRRLADDEPTSAAREALAEFDEAFLVHNSTFKQICHSWQVRGDDQPNDHMDSEYDAGVIAQLADFHDQFLPELATV